MSSKEEKSFEKGLPKGYKKGVLQERKENGVVQCHVCQRECLVPKGKRGFCTTRINIDGTLYSMIYGRFPSGVQIDPIEKKPLHHFHPGTFVASIGSYGCNFRCKQCLNWASLWDFSEDNVGKPLNWDHKGLIISPKEFIEIAKRYRCPGVAFTYNEPTIWIEYVYDAAKLAKKDNLFTVFVTNGYITKKGVDYLGNLIDAWSVDFKGWSDRSYAKQGNIGVSAVGIRDVTKYAKEKYGIHVEIDTLVIPTINDDLEEMRLLAQWIFKNLGEDTPWHLIRYIPELAWSNDFRKIPPTPLLSVEKIAKIGNEVGLKFVYYR
jgi:pyruvate formate lyase activating enzyme